MSIESDNNTSAPDSKEEGSISLIPYETLLNALRKSTPPLNIRDDPTFGSSPPSNRDVISGIAQLLRDGLTVGPLQQDRTKLIDYCMQDLKSNHPGAIWSLQVVQHIFETQNSNETGNLQFYMQTCSSLPELYISNLKAYTSAVKALPPTPSPTVSSFAPLSAHQQSQEYWRGQQLKVRLEFVRAMVKIFPMYWNSAELAETLWSCLIVDPIGIQEQDEAFSCLEAMGDHQFVEYVYERLLPGLEIATITPRAWQCVRQYFLVLNWNWRNLTVLQSMEPSIDGSQVIVVLAPLHGMDLIWKIALHARIPIVGANATSLLSSLIKAYNEQQQENVFQDAIYNFREGLVATCVEHLVNTSDLLANGDAMDMPDVSLVFERCIGILKAFLVACNAERSDGASRPEIHGALDEDAMLTIKITSNNFPLFQMSAHPSGTLGSLRRAIAARFSCSEPEDIRLFSLGKDFVSGWDSRTLEELHVENGQSFLATKRPQSVILTRSQSAPKQVPTDLLLKPEFFERVRHIFLLDEKYASQTWEVVVRLPTSPVLLHSLEDLREDVEWTALLDARSPFLLLYSLQIVNALIKRDQCSDEFAKQTWIKRFLDLGGQQYLTTLLMSESGLGAANSSPTARKALALMLKVLVRLTYSADIEFSMGTDSDGLTIPAFLNKLAQEILTSAAREGGHSPNDQGIVLNATSLISYLCAGPEGWHYFHTGPDIHSLINVSMVQSDSMQIRQT
ncbi:Ubiquitin carboxyl-terminal hydrolase 34, partial [Modicella reniformis]